jgi:hypothetical protein
VPELPASVRLALWVTGAWHDGTGLADAVLEGAVRRALPDAEPTGAAVDRLALWRDLGERAVLCALPASGDLTGVPTTDRETGYAVAAAGECVLAPGLGAVLVPVFSQHGPADGPAADRVAVVDLVPFAGEPVPRHRVEALDPRAALRTLLEQVHRATGELERVGGAPFDARAARAAAAQASAGDRSREWALPPGLPTRVLEALRLAAAVGSVARAGLEGPQDAVDAVTREARDGILRSLVRAADTALAEAANGGVAALAGWVPAR